MIRLVLMLCGGLYFGLLVLGADHGQKRYGLMMADAAPKAAPSLPPAAEPARQVVFIPAQPVMQPAKASATVVWTEVTAVATDPPAALPQPDIPGGTLFSVAAILANVRAGPGMTFAVVGSLAKGEQVLVVPEAGPVDGWSRVRLEGDGVEGYIATRLLTSP